MCFHAPRAARGEESRPCPPPSVHETDHGHETDPLDWSAEGLPLLPVLRDVDVSCSQPAELSRVCWRVSICKTRLHGSASDLFVVHLFHHFVLSVLGTRIS